MFYIKSLLIDVLLVASFSSDYDSKATDSSFCRIALLGFAIQINAHVNMKEGDNQSNKKLLLSNYNPRRSWLGLTEQQNITLLNVKG